MDDNDYNEASLDTPNKPSSDSTSRQDANVNPDHASGDVYNEPSSDNASGANPDHASGGVGKSNRKTQPWKRCLCANTFDENTCRKISCLQSYSSISEVKPVLKLLHDKSRNIIAVVKAKGDRAICATHLRCLANAVNLC